VRRVRANSVRLAAVIAAIASSLLLVTVAYADTPATDVPDRTPTALDEAADADSNADATEETVAANEQSVRGDGESQDQEVSTAQTDRGDDEDARVRKAAADKDCPDFTFQEDAQDYFDRNGGSEDNDFDNLDAEGDGLACESLPSRDDAPTGGPDTGGGGTAPPPNGGSSAGPLPFVLGGAALGLLIALLGPSLRRRVTT
jgi:hypothetical protein